MGYQHDTVVYPNDINENRIIFVYIFFNYNNNLGIPIIPCNGAISSLCNRFVKV